MEFDITNLTLDDNSFTTVPEGDYHFKVVNFDLSYSTSSKLPENTRVVTFHLDVPFLQDGVYDVAKVRTNLNICDKTMFAVRQFAQCVGLVPEKGRVKNVDLTKCVGLSGVCRLLVGISAKGNEYNQVDITYSPSDVPAFCDNDEAWKTYTSEGKFKLMTDVAEEDVEVNPFV